MKFGGYSWNQSKRHKEGVRTKFKCKHCGRTYKMEWAKSNHEKLCKEHFREEEE